MNWARASLGFPEAGDDPAVGAASPYDAAGQFLQLRRQLAVGPRGAKPSARTAGSRAPDWHQIRPMLARKRGEGNIHKAGLTPRFSSPARRRHITPPPTMIDVSNEVHRGSFQATQSISTRNRSSYASRTAFRAGQGVFDGEILAVDAVEDGEIAGSSSQTLTESSSGP